jgi:hypothetical protein
MTSRSRLLIWKLIGGCVVALTGGGCLLPQPHTPPVGLGLPEVALNLPRVAQPADRAGLPTLGRSEGVIQPIEGDPGNALGGANSPIWQQPSSPQQATNGNISGSPIVEPPSQGAISVGAGRIPDTKAPLDNSPGSLAGTPVTPLAGCLIGVSSGQLVIEAPPDLDYELTDTDDSAKECQITEGDFKGRIWQVSAGVQRITIRITKPVAAKFTAEVQIQPLKKSSAQIYQDPLTQAWGLRIFEETTSDELPAGDKQSTAVSGASSGS